MKARSTGATAARGAAAPAANAAAALHFNDPHPHRRAARRVPHRVPCRLTVVDPRSPLAATFIGETIDLSSAGLAVRVPHSVPLGTHVEALVPHLTGEPLLVRGMVIRCRRIMHGQYEVAVMRQDA
jgi:hypothetical protein